MYKRVTISPTSKADYTGKEGSPIAVIGKASTRTFVVKCACIEASRTRDWKRTHVVTMEVRVASKQTKSTNNMKHPMS